MFSLTEKDRKRYWEKVDVRGLDECWPGSGCTNQRGYPLFSVSENGKRQTHNAHRVGLTLRLGQLPNDIHALHSCDNPRCQNPCHVHPGTNLDNIAEKMARGRHRGARGERSSAAKLTREKVESIKARYAIGGVKQKALAAEFGVRQQQISRIVNGKRWVYAHA